MEVIKTNNDLELKKEIDLVTERFENLIADVITSDHLAEILDNIMFKYSTYLLKDKDFGNTQESGSNELYWLRTVRDLFINKITLQG
ncbi:MAG: hypothetical protein ACOYN4_08930 [Bacteroidales bacterium]